ncbi:MAG: YdcF family protein [Thermoflavifilum sp.]|nr:YdcF family protein [Thermoflavifilum sp.]
MRMKKYCFPDPHGLAYCTHALVLGTRKWTGSHLNAYFAYRMEAAAALYAAGRTQIFILSGAHLPGQPNQAEAMKQALIQRKIPESQLVLHPQGYRTWASLQYCRQQHISSLIIISQHFHNIRAVWIARYMGIRVQALDAKDVGGFVRYRMLLRERLARVRMLMDIIQDQWRKYFSKA